MQRQERKQKGITLVALVITIIVLLLLAGVTISLLVGENGIITKAKEGGNRTQQAQEKEKIELAVTASIMEDTDKLTIEEGNLNTELMNELGGEGEYTLTNNQDGSFLIRIEKSKRTYYIGNSGEVIGEENMKKISNAEELKAFRDEVNSGNSYDGWYVYLTDNITLNNTEIWEPIGVAEQTIGMHLDNERHKPFRGIFDGTGHEINGIYINTTDKGQGLFGFVIGGTIKNINLHNSIFNGNGAIGSIVGYMRNSGSIINCITDATVSGKTFVGGIVGYCDKDSYLLYNINKGIITNNSTQIDDNIGLYTGGIVGNFGKNSCIYRCANIGKVTGLQYVGGICGSASSNAKILEVYNLGEIEGTGNSIGGIAGRIYNESLITESYNTGNIVSKGNFIGGIVGSIDKGENIIKNCYSIGNITGNQADPIVGQKNLNSEILNCFSRKDNFSHINLGSAFKTDTNNINNGYPILSWQE